MSTKYVRTSTSLAEGPFRLGWPWMMPCTSCTRTCSPIPCPDDSVSTAQQARLYTHPGMWRAAPDYWTAEPGARHTILVPARSLDYYQGRRRTLAPRRGHPTAPA